MKTKTARVSSRKVIKDGAYDDAELGQRSRMEIYEFNERMNC
jgi:hypothetical protein